MKCICQSSQYARHFLGVFCWILNSVTMIMKLLETGSIYIIPHLGLKLCLYDPQKKKSKNQSIFEWPLKVSRSRKQNCRAIISPKNKQMNLFFDPDDSDIHETWNHNSSFKYFWVVRIKKQIHPFIFWEKLWLDNFVSRSTDL